MDHKVRERNQTKVSLFSQKQVVVLKIAFLSLPWSLKPNKVLDNPCPVRVDSFFLFSFQLFLVRVERSVSPFGSVLFRSVSLTAAAHLPFATVHLPFLINTLALFYNFGKSWKSDPGIIKASEEQKKKVGS